MPLPDFNSLWARAEPLLGDPQYLVSFGILAALLLAAQIFNSFRRRAINATETDRKVGVIVASWWRILLFAFLAFWGGRYTAIPVFFGLTLFAAREYVGVSALNENRRPLLAGAAIGALLHYAAFFTHQPTLFFASFQLYVLLVVMPFVVFTARLHRLAELLAFYLGVMVLVVFLSFPVAVLEFEWERIGSETGARLAVLLLIVLTELNDILQFTCGKLFGRRKIVPWISPNKTEAGFIGGCLLSTLLGALLWPHFIPVTTTQAAALSCLLSLGGMMGDLVCSGVKRYRGVKDFSSLMPGHGGAIDRLDSLLVTAPIFFFFVYLLPWL